MSYWCRQKFLPLIAGDIYLSELRLISPVVNYTVIEGNISNIDSFIPESTENESEQENGISLEIPQLIVENANFYYTDKTRNWEIKVEGLNADLSLRYAEVIETELTSTVDSLSVIIDGESYLENLPLNFDQASVLDLENENLNIESGSLGIRGLSLDLDGNISSWGSDIIRTNLNIASS